MLNLKLGIIKSLEILLRINCTLHQKEKRFKRSQQRKLGKIDVEKIKFSKINIVEHDEWEEKLE